MRFIINIIIIAGLSYLSGNLGWFEWDFAIIAFLVAYLLNANGWSSFLSGFVAIAVLWYVVASMTNNANDGLLAERIATVISMPSGSALLIISALVGGLVGGFSALTGSLAHLMFSPPLKDLRKKNTWRKW